MLGALVQVGFCLMCFILNLLMLFCYAELVLHYFMFWITIVYIINRFTRSIFRGMKLYVYSKEKVKEN